DFISDANQNELPQYDGVDLIRPSNGVTYSLTNRIKARGVASEAFPKGRVWELARFTLSQTYDLEEPPQVPPVSPINQPAPTVSTIPPSVINVKGQRLSDLFADLILEPVYGLQFRGTATFDPYARDVRSATIDVAYQTEAFRASLGTRHGEGGELQFIQGELGARLSPRWSFRFTTNYDIQSATVVENRLEVEFREQCWAITAAFIDRTNEDEFHVSVNLLELGQYGFGRALGLQ